MAKSIRLTEMEAEHAHVTAPLSRGTYWEHWFDGQPQGGSPEANRALDEHSIWEKAVNFEILAMDDKKF